MPHMIALNKDQSLLWRPHPLTEELKTLKVENFVLEPVINSPEAAEATVKIESNQLLLKWDWGNWKQVEISANYAAQRTVLRRCVISQPAEVRWRELPSVSEIELTF